MMSALVLKTAGNNLFTVSNGNARAICEICSELAIKTLNDVNQKMKKKRYGLD